MDRLTNLTDLPIKNNIFIIRKEIIQAYQIIFSMVLLSSKKKWILNLALFYLEHIDNTIKVLVEINIWHHQVFKYCELKQIWNLILTSITVIDVIINMNNVINILLICIIMYKNV